MPERPGIRSRAGSLMHRYALRMLLLSCLALCLSLGIASSAFCAELSEVVVRQNGNDLYVTTTIMADEKFVEDLRNGITKELVIYVDLFRVWTLWPNEFVLGRKIVRTLRNDPIKREYVVTTTEANAHSEKRFTDIGSMLSWATSVTDLRLTNTKALEADEYFVKVTFDSIVKKYSPLLSPITLFGSDKEFSAARSSARFSLHSPAGNR